VLRPRTLAPGVELFAARTPTLLPATHTNSYALGGEEVLLVEPATPYPDEQAAWLDWARRLRAEGRTLVALVATHHHRDHVAGAAFFADALGLPLWAHEATAARLDHPVSRLLREGDEIALSGKTPHRWKVLHTPGHAPGHVVLHEPSLGVLVVGDMVASEGTILIAPGDGDMAEYLRQLARLGDLGGRLALPAHGEPIDEPSSLFARYIAHRLVRESKVLAAVRAAGPEGAPEAEILPVAYADTNPAVFPIALLSLQAHLEKLVAEDQVSLRRGRFVASAA
jgi:glyoxylase-like metal-dependent hydrolase (beta-lactamase superfamily II)